MTITTDPSAANLVLDTGTTSASGGYADGVLGNYSSTGEITLIRGWNWFTGSDPSSIGLAGQYDFETIVSHELEPHLAQELGHSADPASTMFASLSAAESRRYLATADLGLRDPGDGPDALHAASIAVATPTVNLAVALPAPADAVSSALDGLYTTSLSIPARAATPTRGRLNWVAGRAIPNIASSLLADRVLPSDSRHGMTGHEPGDESSAHPAFSGTTSIQAPARPRLKRAKAHPGLPKPPVVHPMSHPRGGAPARPVRPS